MWWWIQPSLPSMRDGKLGVLLDFPNMTKVEQLQHCENLSAALTHDGQPDIDGRQLAAEMQNFPHFPSKKMSNKDPLTFLHDERLTEICPNMWVALRSLQLFPVTVAAAERSFSKLKLIMTYLRATMVQGRLSVLAIISINHVVSKQLT